MFAEQLNLAFAQKPEIPIELQPLLNRSDCALAISISGGKDSQAQLNWLCYLDSIDRLNSRNKQIMLTVKYAIINPTISWESEISVDLDEDEISETHPEVLAAVYDDLECNLIDIDEDELEIEILEISPE